ncbi:MAG: hypothetical protein WA049_16530 [Ferribacterium limneticum]|jgi:hypothetical protein
MATEVCVLLASGEGAGDFNFGHFFRLTVALYHLGGICTIVVIRDNGSGVKGAYHGRLSIFSMRLAS